MVGAIRQTLVCFATHKCMALGEVTEACVAKGVPATNPLVRLTALRWLLDSLDGEEALDKKQLAGLEQVLHPLSDDGTEEVRKDAFEGLAKVARRLDAPAAAQWVAKLQHPKKQERLQKLLGGDGAQPTARAPAPSKVVA